MKVSDLVLDGREYAIQTKTDAYRLVRSELSRDNYIAEFGDVDIVPGHTENWYVVPAHAEVVAEYVAAKARACEIWGCE
jgi:hypothetical protein